MVKNQFSSKTTNTVRFTKKCSQEADKYFWAFWDRNELCSPKVCQSYVNFIKFDLFVTFVMWLHGCCYGQPSKIGLKYVFSWFARI